MSSQAYIDMSAHNTYSTLFNQGVQIIRNVGRQHRLSGDHVYDMLQRFATKMRSILPLNNITSRQVTQTYMQAIEPAMALAQEKNIARHSLMRE